MQSGAPPAAQPPEEVDSTDVLDKIRQNQKEFASKSALRILISGLAFFFALEVSGNFEVIGKSFSNPRENIDLSSWNLSAGLDSSDVTVIVTALLIFNATFAIAFVATFLVEVKETEFDYFRTDWGQKVQTLSVLSASLAASLAITRFQESPGLFVALALAALFIALASQLVNGKFFAQTSAAIAIDDAKRKLKAAKKAREIFLDSVGPQASVRIRTRKEPASVKAAKGLLRRYSRTILLYVLLLGVSLGILTIPFGLVIFVKKPPVGTIFEFLTFASMWIFVVLVIVTFFPVWFGVTVGQVNIWISASQGRKISWFFRVLRTSSVAFVVVVWITLPGGDGSSLGLFLSTTTMMAALAAATATYIGWRTARGPGKHVVYLSLSQLDLNVATAEAALKEAEKKAAKEKAAPSVVRLELDPSDQGGNGHKSGVVVDKEGNRT